MKKVILIMIVILAGCKKHHEDPKPVYKSAPLKIEYSDSYTSSFYSNLYLNVGSQTVKTFPGVAATSHTFVLDTTWVSGQTIQFGGSPMTTSNSSIMYGSYHIKITYNGVVLADKAIPSASSGVFCNADLPIIQ